MRPKSLPARIAVIAAAVLFLAVGAWALAYPGDDPKGIPYTLWKAGVYKMDPALAADIMIGDRHRDKLVIGKTKEQIERRFGLLLTPEQASPYYRSGYGAYGKKIDALFIRDSPWMIIFNNGRATELVLMKGY